MLTAGIPLLPWVAAQEPSNSEARKKPSTPVEARTVDVEFSDQGAMRMVLEIEKLEMETPYGKASIPVEEIRGIALATRVSEKTQQAIDKAIFDLGSAEFSVREAAVNTLRDLKEKGYPALLKATKHPDLEVAHRAQELATKIRDSLPPEKLEVREYDVVETVHSKISGRITGNTLAVDTSQFGKQSLQLTDVRSVRSLLAKVEVKAESLPVEADPGNLTGLREAFGKTFAFRVTGRVDGSVYGTGVYTTDTTLAAAAVHVGVLKVGETGVVRVTIIPSPPAFTSSTQNGVTSYSWGLYPAAYQIHVPKK